jgi:hypothetical protein
MSFLTRVDSAGAFALIQIVVGVWEQTNHEAPLFRLLIFKKEKSDDARTGFILPGEGWARSRRT